MGINETFLVVFQKKLPVLLMVLVLGLTGVAGCMPHHVIDRPGEAESRSVEETRVEESSPNGGHGNAESASQKATQEQHGGMHRMMGGDKVWLWHGVAMVIIMAVLVL